MDNKNNPYKAMITICLIALCVVAISSLAVNYGIESVLRILCIPFAIASIILYFVVINEVSKKAAKLNRSKSLWWWVCFLLTPLLGAVVLMAIGEEDVKEEATERTEIDSNLAS